VGTARPEGAGRWGHEGDLAGTRPPRAAPGLAVVVVAATGIDPGLQKVDRTFVAGMAHDEADEAIVGTVIHLAHALGLRVVAEGVEHADVVERLVATGCDVLQGFLISRPLPAHLVAPWVRARRQEHAEGRGELASLRSARGASVGGGGGRPLLRGIDGARG
jgi:hypothetical protein